jgi:DNA replication protein DnaC
VPVQTCPICHGVGWRIVENDGISGAEKCDCRGEELSLNRLDNARIPPNFQNKSLENFLCESRRPELDSQLRDVWLTVNEFASGKLKEPGLLLTGDPGSGKTHLAVAALKLRIAKGASGLFYNYQELLNNIIASYKPEAGGTAREAYREALDAEILLIDDLGANRVTEWVQDTITAIITHRYDNRKPLIATTNLPDGEAGFVRAKRSQDGSSDYRRTLADHIGERARSRLFEMCRVVKMPPVDDFRLPSSKKRH